MYLVAEICGPSASASLAPRRVHVISDTSSGAMTKLRAMAVTLLLAGVGSAAAAAGTSSESAAFDATAHAGTTATAIGSGSVSGSASGAGTAAATAPGVASAAPTLEQLSADWVEAVPLRDTPTVINHSSCCAHRPHQLAHHTSLHSLETACM